MTQGSDGQHEPLPLPINNAGPQSLRQDRIAHVSEDQTPINTTDHSPIAELLLNRTPMVDFDSDTQIPLIVNPETVCLRRSPSWFK